MTITLLIIYVLSCIVPWYLTYKGGKSGIPPEAFHFFLTFIPVVNTATSFVLICSLTIEKVKKKRTPFLHWIFRYKQK